MGDYTAWESDWDVPQSLEELVSEMQAITTDDQSPTEQDVLDQMGGDDPSVDRSGEKEALYGNKGYTGNEASSGFGVGDLMKSASSLVKNNPGLMQTMLAGVAGAYKDKNTREMSQAQLDAIKQRQTDLNNSVPKFGKAIHGKNYKG